MACTARVLNGDSAAETVHRSVQRQRLVAVRAGAHDGHHQLEHRRIGRWRGLLEPRHTRLLRLGQADPELEAERGGHLVGEVLPDPTTIDPADQLAGEPAVCERVIAVGAARHPHRLLCGERGDDGVHGDDVVERQRRVDVRQPALVAQQLRDRDRLLALRRELRPVRGDGGVVVDLARLDELGHTGRGSTLRRREHELERVLVPRPAGRPVGYAGPDVDLAVAVDVQRERRAELPVVVEVGAERIGHLPVAVLHRAVDLRHPGDGSDAPRPATDRAPRHPVGGSTCRVVPDPT